MSKIGSFVPVGGKIEGVKHFKPCQSLLLALKYDAANYSIDSFLYNHNISVLVDLQNSSTGTRTTIVPYVPLSVLSQISTYNEGAIQMTNDVVVAPIMLNPAGSVRLDQDKFLEISISGLPATVSSVTFYAFEHESPSEFISKYSKLSISPGISRQSFSLSDSDILALPVTSFDEVQITYENGVVVTRTPLELTYELSAKNDITAYKLEPNTKHVLYDENTLNVELIPSGDFFILNLLKVRELLIVRDSNPAAIFEFYTADLVK